MAHLVDKDRIVAELEKAIDEPAPPYDQQCPWEDGYYCGLSKAESIIDVIEVKEMDLEKEIDEWIKDNTCRGYCSASIRETAEHFFELGLKAQKGE